MSRKPQKTQNQDDFEAELKGEVPVFNGVAVTILAKQGGGFNIVKVSLDEKNLVAGEVEVLDTAEGRLEAIEKFKLNVVRHGIIG